MLIANVGNMLVNSIGRTLETGVVPTQYIVIILTFRWQSEAGIQHWINVGPIVNFCLGTDTFVKTILPYSGGLKTWSFDENSESHFSHKTNTFSFHESVVNRKKWASNKTQETGF